MPKRTGTTSSAPPRPRSRRSKSKSEATERHPAFKATRTCDECPWRKDVAPGRFGPERFAALTNTVREGMKPLFACHKTPDGQPTTCVGYLLVDGVNNFRVRLAIIRGQLKMKDLKATGPLYSGFPAMARANGLDIPDDHFDHDPTPNVSDLFE